MMFQSAAIARYLGAKHGYYPTDLVKAQECDSMVDALSDLYFNMKPMYLGNLWTKFFAFREFRDEHLPNFMSRIDKRLEGKKYFGGDEPNLLDFHVGAFTTNPLDGRF
mmetsp:Transcript_33220/g.23952  ORF Transcript_33220/g.23952 Transcript_33220/m.23952 type:complete len:108 (+) Transcript_33220:201-524(+)|eukprot:CAMPEP_0116882568 /NCGR_PEP_ID=MMETSP0463-20121206/14848_1 /TAXON_ID=181622 /ORGANISM="Strombidinopsis sp, Strain SopsisLIS2011" /LENGTH=107 /DNA_ID=CAMNT_0004535979 /DNA_START=140 /DNA_END=466 /DNA_ORIENTATION=-